MAYGSQQVLPSGWQQQRRTLKIALDSLNTSSATSSKDEEPQDCSRQDPKAPKTGDCN